MSQSPGSSVGMGPWPTVEGCLEGQKGASCPDGPLHNCPRFLLGPQVSGCGLLVPVRTPPRHERTRLHAHEGRRQDREEDRCLPDEDHEHRAHGGSTLLLFSEFWIKAHERKVE